MRVAEIRVLSCLVRVRVLAWIVIGVWVGECRVKSVLSWWVWVWVFIGIHTDVV